MYAVSVLCLVSLICALNFDYCAFQGKYDWTFQVECTRHQLYEGHQAALPRLLHLRRQGILSVEVQLDLFETVNIRLECPYRLNQKNWKLTFIPFAKARKIVETLFSQLADQFLLIRNYAKETCGLFARVVGKISVMTALQYINYMNNKPIERIKYALI